MNEIQAVKTAKIEEVKKNSKKGFTLVELVVVIAILAILAAIAIPVVASTIASSQRSSALSNAQTLELAIKEAHAQIIAKDTSIYTDGDKTTLNTVVTKKAIKVEKEVKISNVDYTLNWSKSDSKCYYIDKDSKSLDGKDLKGKAAGDLTAIDPNDSTTPTYIVTLVDGTSVSK